MKKLELSLRAQRSNLNDICQQSVRFFCCLLSLVYCFSCAKPLATAKPKLQPGISKIFAEEAGEVYQGLLWAMKTGNYPIDVDDKQGGVIISRWVPVTSDSHYVRVFDRKDYGVSGAYHRLEASINTDEGGTRLEIVSNVQSVVTDIHSSGREETKMLEKVANYLRSSDISVTNLGVESHGL